MNEDVSAFVQSCLDGDTASWDRVRSISLKFLRSRCGSQADDHADIVQEVFVKLLKGFRQFGGTTEQELRQYINVTTVRESVSYYRKTARHKSHDSIDQTFDDEDSGATLRDILPDNRLDPAAVTAIKDLLQRSSDKLSVRDMQIILFKAEGYKDREIGEILGMTTGGVGVTYNRITGLLRRTLLILLLIILSGRKIPWMTSL